MPKTKKIPLRKELKRSDTWDLSKLFKSDKAWEKAFAGLEGEIDGFARFRGTLGNSAKALKACCNFDKNVELQGEPLGSYAFLKASEDVGNSRYQGMVARFTHMATRMGEAASFIAPEIQSIPKKKLEAFVKSPTLKG